MEARGRRRWRRPSSRACEVRKRGDGGGGVVPLLRFGAQKAKKDGAGGVVLLRWPCPVRPGESASPASGLEHAVGLGRLVGKARGAGRGDGRGHRRRVEGDCPRRVVGLVAPHERGGGQQRDREEDRDAGNGGEGDHCVGDTREGETHGLAPCPALTLFTSLSMQRVAKHCQLKKASFAKTSAGYARS